MNLQTITSPSSSVPVNADPRVAGSESAPLEARMNDPSSADPPPSPRSPWSPCSRSGVATTPPRRPPPAAPPRRRRPAPPSPSSSSTLRSTRSSSTATATPSTCSHPTPRTRARHSGVARRLGHHGQGNDRAASRTDGAVGSGEERMHPARSMIQEGRSSHHAVALSVRRGVQRIAGFGCSWSSSRRLRTRRPGRRERLDTSVTTGQLGWRVA